MSIYSRKGRIRPLVYFAIVRLDAIGEGAYTLVMDKGIAVIAGGTGYIGKFAVIAFKQAGYRVRAITRDEARLAEPGPFHAPGVREYCDEVVVAEVTKPETLAGVMEGASVVFSSVGISRQRDMLTFEQVDYQANKNLLEAALASDVGKFIYVSMWGPEVIEDLAITQAHERVVEALAEAPIEYAVVRPSGYFSDMGALMDMAKRGRAFIIGSGNNRFNPVHGADVAQAAVDAVASELVDHGVGGPDVYTQTEAAELAFDVLGKPPKLTYIPMSVARGGVRFVRLLSKQFGDLADFIVTAGEIDGVAPQAGKLSLRAHFEELAASE
jgi:uncharacterized protein YbjT (DUF2867 family)